MCATLRFGARAHGRRGQNTHAVPRRSEVVGRLRAPARDERGAGRERGTRARVLRVRSTAFCCSSVCLGEPPFAGGACYDERVGVGGGDPLGARARTHQSIDAMRSRPRTQVRPRRGAAARGASAAAGLRGAVGLASFGYKKGFTEHLPGRSWRARPTRARPRGLDCSLAEGLATARATSAGEGGQAGGEGEGGGRWVFEVGHETGGCVCGGGDGDKGCRLLGARPRACAGLRVGRRANERPAASQRRRRLESPGGRWQGRGACGRG